MKPQNKILDIFKLFFSICIVFLHTGFFWNYRKGYFIIQLLLRLAVPFFFIVSGYLYRVDVDNSDIKESTNKFVNRLLKIYIPWSLIYIIFLFCTYENFSEYYFLSQLTKIVSGNVSSTLWYVGSLIISILIISKMKTKKQFLILLIFSLLLYVIGLIFTTYSFLFVNIIPNWQSAFINVFLNNRNFIFVGLIFTLIGYYIKDLLFLLKNRLLLGFLFIVFGFLLIIETIYIYKYLRLLVEYDYLISYLLFVPLLIIILIRINNIIKINFDTKFIRNLSTTIYLIHYLVIKLLDYLVLRKYIKLPYLQFHGKIYGIIVLIIVLLLSICINLIKSKKIKQYIC